MTTETQQRIIELIDQLIEDDALSECEVGGNLASLDRYEIFSEIKKLTLQITKPA